MIYLLNYLITVCLLFDKILSKIFTNEDKEINIELIISKIKELKNFQQCLKPVLVEYLRKAIFFELEIKYLVEYVHFLCEQTIIDCKTCINQDNGVSNEFKTQINSIAEASILCTYDFL